MRTEIDMNVIDTAGVNPIVPPQYRPIEETDHMSPFRNTVLAVATFACVAALYAGLSDNDAMNKCMVKYSHATCRELLR